MTQEILAKEIITTRYPRPHNMKLEEYLEKYGSSKKSVSFILDQLSHFLDHPFSWENYAIPDSLQNHNTLFKKISQNKIADFRKLPKYNKKVINEFFLENHQIFKYAVQRWLIVNAGICFELFSIQEDEVDRKFLVELFKRGVNLGDKVIHIHIISNNERQELTEIGFPVPYNHLDRRYYTEALITANTMLQSSPNSLGLFCEDSWVFDPNLYNLASDGKPYVAFDFLKEAFMVGERFFVGDAHPDNYHYKQYEFALRNPRRHKLYQKGEYNPRTYGIFYPKELLKNNILSGLINLK